MAIVNENLIRQLLQFIQNINGRLHVLYGACNVLGIQHKN